MTPEALARLRTEAHRRLTEIEGIVGAEPLIRTVLWNMERHIDGEPARRKMYEKAEADLERERMRLAACSVVAQANTPESAKAAREMHADYRSASCDDVAAAVDREMALRAERDRFSAEAAELRSKVGTLKAHLSTATTRAEKAEADLAAMTEQWKAELNHANAWMRKYQAAEAQVAAARAECAGLIGRPWSRWAGDAGRDVLRAMDEAAK